MNLHTFKDVVTSKRSSLANDIDEDDEEVDVAAHSGNIEGEEDDGNDKFNELGEVIEPFNLRNEREKGHFDTNMNFVWKKDDVERDAWLADMDEATMEKSIGEAAKAMKLKQDKENNVETPSIKSDKYLKQELLAILHPGETVITAMRRLGGKQARRSTQVVKRRLPTSSTRLSTLSTSSRTCQESSEREVKGEREREKESQRDSAGINNLTELCDELISSGLTGLYYMTYEAIQSSMFLWEYKGRDGEIHGPYSTKQISKWRKVGYFTGTQAVMMRRVREIDEDSNTIKHGHKERGRERESDNMDDKESEQGIKRQRIEREEVVEESKRERNVKSDYKELLDDLDDMKDEDEDAKKLIETKQETETETNKLVEKEKNNEFYKDCWILSDEIDFGDFDELPENNQENDSNQGDENENEDI